MVMQKKEANIYTLPQVQEDRNHDSTVSYTVGDAHGNPIKLTYFLMEKGILSFKEGINAEEVYSELVKLYEDNFTEEDNGIIAAQLNRFSEILGMFDVKTEATVRLMGDVLADRGANDIFTLRLLKLLFDSKVDVKILISNHDAEFFECYDDSKEPLEIKGSRALDRGQAHSLDSLAKIYNDKLVSPAELRALVAPYKKSLKLLDYELKADGGIVLFTHAPARFDLIAKIAARLAVPYDDSTAQNLGKTIDAMNAKFAEIVENNQIPQYFNPGFSPNDYLPEDNFSDYSNQKSVLSYLIWHRWSKKEEELTPNVRPARVESGANSYSLTYVHGHDSYQSEHEHIHCLDTDCGKYSQLKQKEPRMLKNGALDHGDSFKDYRIFTHIGFIKPELAPAEPAPKNIIVRFFMAIASAFSRLVAWIQNVFKPSRPAQPEPVKLSYQPPPRRDRSPSSILAALGGRSQNKEVAEEQENSQNHKSVVQIVRNTDAECGHSPPPPSSSTPKG